MEQERDAELIDSIVEVDREIAAAEARRAALMREFVALRHRDTVSEVGAAKAGVLAGQFALDEVAAAVCWSTARVQAEVARVRLLQTRLPRVWRAWAAGTVDGYRVSKVVEAAARLVDSASVAELDEQAAVRAPGKTATQLGGWLNRFVARAEPDQAERRHGRAMVERRVQTRAQADGMGSVWALLNAVDTAAVDQVLTERARAAGADDPRTMDQRRADALVDLVLGRADGAERSGQAAVAITVPLQSLLGLCDAPGELVDRTASVPASLARQIAARPGTLFYRVLTDPRGQVLDVTEVGRFPSPLLGFAVDIRDGPCRWPTCTARASGCDANHEPPWPIGLTRAADLADQCRRHHNGVTHAGFGVRHPSPGMVEWTTPSGHAYTVAAEPVPVMAWWPAERDTPCPCEACDQPRPTDVDIAEALAPGEDVDDLAAEEISAIHDAA